MAKSALRHRVSCKDSDEYERMLLIEEDREVFLEALMNPPKPTERLVAAMRRYQATFPSSRQAGTCPIKGAKT